MKPLHLIAGGVVIAVASATSGVLVTRRLMPEPPPPKGVELPEAPVTPTARIVELPGTENTAHVDELETEIASLRAELGVRLNQVRDLEQALADQQIADPGPEPEARSEAPRPQRESFGARLERMKEEEPDRYAAMQKARNEFRDRMERRTAERAAFLLDVSTEQMSDEQQKNHQRLVSLIEQTWSMQQQLRDDSAEVDRRELHQQLMTNGREMAGLFGDERQYLLEQTARDLGYQGSEVPEFAAHVQSIYDMTSMNPFGGRGHSHRQPQSANGNGGQAGVR